MRTSVLESLSRIHAAVVGDLSLRRVWARASDHLALEYAGVDGRPVGAQWFSHAASRSRAALGLRAVSGTEALHVEVDRGEVLVHVGGVDASLPGLQTIVREPAAELVSHYPDRRAVVRIVESGQVRYVKVVRPERAASAIRAHEHAAVVARGRFLAPAILERDAAQGRFTLASIPGDPLHAIREGPRLIDGYRGAGAALRLLHDSPVPDWAKPHSPSDDIESLRERLELAGVFAPEIAALARSRADSVIAALEHRGAARALVHRDFHEKQAIVCGDGAVGLIDFDTLAVGDPAVDVANMLAHIELAEVQGRLGASAARESALAFLAGYGLDPGQSSSLAPIVDATRLRLALLFAYRPRWAWSSPGVLDRIGQPPLGAANARPRGRTRSPSMVFVVGCPRSGTTLLERMLDAHPEIAMAHETNWVTRACKGRGGLDPESAISAADIDRMYADHRFARMGVPRTVLDPCVGGSYRAFVRRVYESFADARGKPRAGDKSTGGYLRNLHLLRQVCPGAKIVHLVRDGRDVALSMLSWPKAGRAVGRFKLWELDPLAAVAAWWRWHVLAGVADGRPMGSDVYREFKYEELVAEPEIGCRAICDFVGLGFDRAMLSFSEGRTNPSPGLSANAAWLPPTPGLRDWRAQMPQENAALFEAIAGDALDILGYERRHSRTSQEIAERATDRLRRWNLEVQPQEHASHLG